MNCTHEGCDRKVHAGGLCMLHYGRQWRNTPKHKQRLGCGLDKIEGTQSNLDEARGATDTRGNTRS